MAFDNPYGMLSLTAAVAARQMESEAQREPILRFLLEDLGLTCQRLCDQWPRWTETRDAVLNDRVAINQALKAHQQRQEAVLAAYFPYV
jgi:hypothetical protein